MAAFGTISPAAAPVVSALPESPKPVRQAKPAPPPKVDADGDRVFDDLEARLVTTSPAERVGVIVTLEATTLERLQRRIGAFPVTRRFRIVDGFAARLTPRQIELLARVPGVRYVE
jgi:Peptidase inhibitor I9